MISRIQKFVFENRYAFSLILLLLFYSTDAYAVYEIMEDVGKEIAAGLRKIIYPAATIGISCVCIGGMFGNFNWKWLISILLGLFVIAYSVQVGDIATVDSSMSGID